jgi:hypothetical protein
VRKECIGNKIQSIIKIDGFKTVVLSIEKYIQEGRNTAAV